MIVLRIEDRFGTGMYTSYNFPSFHDIAGFDDTNHPTPMMDSLLMSNLGYNDNMSSHHFGFGSVDQLRRWIYNDDWLRQLHNAGFILVTYDVPDEYVFLGNTQCVFTKCFAYKREEHSIVRFFSLW